MKKKRNKQRAKYRAATQPQTLPKATATPSPTSKRVVSAGSAELGSLAIHKDRYRYLPSDLRQIGVIAGGLFLILIVLSFILG